MAVNRRVLAGSLAAALVISVAGGYMLSRNDGAGSADDNVTITSNGIYLEPGIGVDKAVQGATLPDVTLHATDGSTVSTASLLALGKPLVLNVWATNCEACKTEMPALAKVDTAFKAQVHFVGINLTQNTPSALSFAKDKGVTYQLLSDSDGSFVSALGIAGLPYTLFVAPNGTIVAQKGIALDEATIRASVQQLLAAS